MKGAAVLPPQKRQQFQADFMGKNQKDLFDATGGIR
jgi:hypothetical protein